MTYDRDENYCSFSPDELFGVRFNYGCYLHDRQYRNEVITRKTRKQADLLLRDTMYRAFIIANKKYRGFLISRIYYYGVRILGRPTWVKG